MNILSDIKYAFRQMQRTPGVTLVTMLTLALGVGVNAAVFCVLYNVLLKPLPYPDSDRLVVVKTQSLETGKFNPNLTQLEFNAFDVEDKVFEYVAGFSDEIINLSGINVPVRAFGTRISPEFLSAFGVVPVIGRTFSNDDYKVGQTPAVIISYSLWHTEFSGRTDIVGKDILLDGKLAKVCGVMPKKFKFPLRYTSYWRPLILTDEEAMATEERFINTIGLVKRGVSPEQLASQLDRISQDFYQSNMVSGKSDKDFSAISLIEDQVGDRGNVVWILFASATCVTLIGVANLVNITISRLIVRRREFAIRMSLGADLWKICQKIFLEYGLISIISGIIGVLFAGYIVPLLRSLTPYNFPRSQEIVLDYMVVIYGISLSFIMGVSIVIVSLVSLLKNDHIDISVLKSYYRNNNSRWHKFSQWLIAGQAAIATILLIFTALFWASFQNVSRIDPGFSTDKLLSARILLSPSAYSHDNASREFYRQLVDRVAAMPEITEAGLVNALPLSDIRFSRPLLYKGIDGQECSNHPDQIQADYTTVSMNYFHLMQIPLIRGRIFQDTDRYDEPVVVVSKSLAELLHDGGYVIGSQIRIGPRKWRPLMTIVGIVEDIRVDGQDKVSKPTFYVPYFQKHLPTYTTRGMFVVAKSILPPEATIKNLRSELGALNPNLALSNIKTMSDRLYESSLGRRYNSSLMGTFSILAIFLVVIGIFGVLSRMVIDSKREFGIRLSLGASREDIFKFIFVQGLIPVFIGIVIGWGIALVIQNAIAGFIFGISASDPVTFIFVGMVIVFTTILACYLPAKKAISLDPMIVIRCE